MRKLVTALISAAFLAPTASADTLGIYAITGSYIDIKAETHLDIEAMEWSLRNSSVAKTLDNYVLDKSLSMVERAKEEARNGNYRTAREFVRRAGQPLSNMAADAMAGKHPEPTSYKQELRATLASLLPEAQRIALEKGYSTNFIHQTNDLLESSDALFSRGQRDDARALLEEANSLVRQNIARMRSGDYLYVEILKRSPAEDWLDGLRRIEERRMISQFLLVEAEASGIDIQSLQLGLQSAEATVARAESMAEEQRWHLALNTLDQAYVQFEESWRTAGVDW